MNGYRMLSDEDIAGFKQQGWEEVEIAELELYMLNNTTRGAILQMKDELRKVWNPVFELINKPMTKLVRKIIGRK